MYRRYIREIRTRWLSLKVTLTHGPTPICKATIILLFIPLFILISVAKVHYHEYEPHTETSSHYHDTQLYQQHSKAPFPWLNAYLSTEERVNQLVGSMHINEKLALLSIETPELPRIGLPAYSWYSLYPREALVVFPQPIGLAATFNTDLIFEVAAVTRNQILLQSYLHFEANSYHSYYGRNILSPSVDVFANALNGHGQATFGEDPLLISRMVVSYIRGLQQYHEGNDNVFAVAAACTQYLHFTSNESTRLNMTRSDIYQTYLPPLYACIVEGGATMVTCSMKRIVNDRIACMSPLLHTHLRRYDGIIMTEYENQRHDNDAGNNHMLVKQLLVNNVHIYDNNYNAHNFHANNTYFYVDQAISRTIRTMMKINVISPKAFKLPTTMNPKDYNELARKTAAQSIVLLKNAGTFLPLSFVDPSVEWSKRDYRSEQHMKTAATIIKKVAVVGPNLYDTQGLYGSNSACRFECHHRQLRRAPPNSCQHTTLYDGIRKYVSSYDGTEIRSTIGATNHTHVTKSELDETLRVVHGTDVVIVLLGLTSCCDNHDNNNGQQCHEYNKHGDRDTLELPASQLKLVNHLTKHTTIPIVIVILAGGPLDISEFVINPRVSSILYAWYPGSFGANAIADIIFGHTNPSGRLPVSFPLRTEDVPSSTDASMNGRTYRYTTKMPLFSFGYGLSYTNFEHKVSMAANSVTVGNDIVVSVFVKNIGLWAGTDVIQVYMKRQVKQTSTNESFEHPKIELKAFERIFLNPSTSGSLELRVKARDLRIYTGGLMTNAPVTYTLYVTNDGPPQHNGKYVPKKSQIYHKIIHIV